MNIPSPLDPQQNEMPGSQLSAETVLSPSPRPQLRRLPPVPYVEADDPRLDDFRAIDLDVSQVLDWANCTDTLFRRNRIQLLSSFAVLIPLLTKTELSELSIVMELSALVDRGDRLVESLARIFGVSMAAVRYFCGRSAAEIGLEWINNPYEVILAIETARAVKRPSSREEWAIFRRYWDDSRQTIRAYNLGPLSRPRDFINEYLFAAMCRLGYRASSLRRLNRATGNRPECIRQVGDYFHFVDDWCSAKWPPEIEADMQEPASPTLSERLLMRYPLPELIRQSQCWHREIVQFVPSPTDVDGQEDLTPANSWPGLLRTPYGTNDLVAVSLVCGDELRLEGFRLQHCVGTYVEPCLKGESHIVSIRNAQGDSLSTAEIELVREGDGWKPRVIQHAGINNSDPDPGCSDVLDRVVRSLDEPASQQWIAKLQAAREERQDQIAMYLLDMREEQTRFAQTVMLKILPDYEVAYGWLERMTREEAR